MGKPKKSYKELWAEQLGSDKDFPAQTMTVVRAQKLAIAAELESQARRLARRAGQFKNGADMAEHDGERVEATANRLCQIELQNQAVALTRRAARLRK